MLKWQDPPGWNPRQGQHRLLMDLNGHLLVHPPTKAWDISFRANLDRLTLNLVFLHIFFFN